MQHSGSFWWFPEHTDSHYIDIQPPPCVLNALTDAAIAACDALDGIEDGVISLPGQCNFSAAAIVGQVVECTNPSGSVTITSDLARLADAIWTGRLADIGTSGWYGLHQDSPMTVLLNTTCTSIDNCTILPFPITTEWTQVFLARNSSYDVNSMTVDDYARFFRQSVDEYESIIGTESADLTNLRNAGTKVIVWHGMQDQIIATNGTIDYYERVLANDLNGNVTDYYRLFLAPGIEHCGIGNGFDPTPTMFNALRDWVENDAIPETLEGTGSILGGGSNSPTRSVGLCPYPSVLTYIGDDPNDAASFICV